MNPLKQILFLSFFFMVMSAISFSQSIYFCEGVDSEGYPKNPSSVFNISKDGGYLYVLVELPYQVQCHSVSFVIYKTDSGNMKYDNTIYVDVERNWTWFWKQITFYQTGKYTVYVYDCDDNLLTSGDVRIQYY